MVTVEIVRPRRIDPTLAERIYAGLTQRMGVPMKQRPNIVADIEYRFDDEGFLVRIERVPMHRDDRTGRLITHALVSEVVDKQAREMAQAARQRHNRHSAPQSPVNLNAKLNANFLNAA